MEQKFVRSTYEKRIDARSTNHRTVLRLLLKNLEVQGSKSSAQSQPRVPILNVQPMHCAYISKKALK